MKTVSVFTLLAAASLSVAAQQQAPNQKQQPQNAAPDKEIVERLRTEGAAGGTRPVPPEKRKAVGANAGPHLHHNAPRPTKLPKDQPVEPPK